MGDGRVRAAGVAIAMQGSGISGVDVGSATIKLGDEGCYNLTIGAADMGTGCDTILAQIAADCLDCDVDDISVFGGGTYVLPLRLRLLRLLHHLRHRQGGGKGLRPARRRICALAAQMLDVRPRSAVEFAGRAVRRLDGKRAR